MPLIAEPPFSPLQDHAAHLDLQTPTLEQRGGAAGHAGRTRRGGRGGGEALERADGEAGWVGSCE